MSLRIQKKLKLSLFPADWVILNCFQNIAEFKAGRITIIIPANTGSASNNNTAVTKIAQPNNGTLCSTCPGIRIFITVVMKFIAPNIEEIPAKCNENMARSTDPPLWACAPAKGG